jgi:hypothetical protein
MTDSRWAVSRQKAISHVAPPVLSSSEGDRARALSNSLVILHTEGDVVREVSKLWQEAQERFLTIGRYLVRAKQQFKGSFERDILPQLPFGKQVAFQLRTVAAAVDGGKVDERVLPRSYSTAYSLVTLEDEHLAVARSRNLVRPDVVRSELEAFRREMRMAHSIGSEQVAALELEQRQLVRDLERIQRRLQVIDQDMEQLKKQYL